MLGKTVGRVTKGGKGEKERKRKEGNEVGALKENVR